MIISSMKIISVPRQSLGIDCPHVVTLVLAHGSNNVVKVDGNDSGDQTVECHDDSHTRATVAPLSGVTPDLGNLVGVDESVANVDAADSLASHSLAHVRGQGELVTAGEGLWLPHGSSVAHLGCPAQ
jgi:hypothetical protein